VEASVTEPGLVIGIAGQICSGKSSVARFLETAYGFARVSLSDLVHDLHRERRGEEKRVTALKTANFTRAKRGGSHFVTAGIDRLRQIGGGVGVLTGIYCMDEVVALKSHPNSVLIGVVCESDDERFARLYRRLAGRLDAISRADFDQLVILENEGGENHLADVASVLDASDWIIRNEGSREDLVAQVVQFSTECLGAFARIATGTIQSAMSSGVVDMHRLRELQLRHVLLKEIVEPYFLQTDRPEMEAAMASFVASRHSVAQISNQLSSRLLDVFLIESASEAFAEYRGIQPGTADDELALLLNEAQFADLHKMVHDKIALSESKVHNEVVDLVAQHRADDKAQFDVTIRRSMSKLRQDGVRIWVLPTHVSSLRDYQRMAASGPIPLTEHIKNQRILSVDRFDGAKVSHVIHDFVDHAWLFDLLEEKRVLADHRRLIGGIGDPHLTDVFKREGEVVASIGFGVRLWAAQQVGFIPMYRLSDIYEVLDKRFIAGDVCEPAALESYKHLKRLVKNPHLRESQSLEFVFSNYMVELDEQRRKHGRIWFNDGTSIERQELDPWGVEFLSYFIAAHRVIVDSKSKHRDALLRTHIMVEEYLMSESAIQGEALRLLLADLRSPVTSDPNIPWERVTWMARNYGFSALKPTVN
jgi:hypothetical protein